MITRILIGFIGVLVVTIIIDLVSALVSAESEPFMVMSMFLFILFCSTVGTLGIALFIWLPLFNLIGHGVQFLSGKIGSGDEPVFPSWVKFDSGKELIAAYIRDRLAVEHESMEVISAHLHDMGWSDDAVRQAIKEVESTPAEARGKSKAAGHKPKPKRHSH